MPIIAELVELYRSEGIAISTGLPPHRFGGYGGAPFTWFLKDGQSLTNGLGIAMQEVYLLEHLFAAFQPRRALVIGNAFGWSTLAIAALLKGGQVVAIDSGSDRNSLAGLELTNRLAARGKLPAKAVKGTSPGDVATIVNTTLAGPVDFAFIDGLHTSAQVVLDYTAVRAKAAADAVYLFHDVQEFGLGAGIAEIEHGDPVRPGPASRSRARGGRLRAAGIRVAGRTPGGVGQPSSPFGALAPEFRQAQGSTAYACR